jgi:hypothetical protein
MLKSVILASTVSTRLYALVLQCTMGCSSRQRVRQGKPSKATRLFVTPRNEEAAALVVPLSQTTNSVARCDILVPITIRSSLRLHSWLPRQLQQRSIVLPVTSGNNEEFELKYQTIVSSNQDLSSYGVSIPNSNNQNVGS